MMSVVLHNIIKKITNEIKLTAQMLLMMQSLKVAGKAPPSLFASAAV